MNKEIEILKHNADSALYSYHHNLISRNEAKIIIEKYIDAYNNKSKEIAKKYNMKPKLLNFSSFIR